MQAGKLPYHNLKSSVLNKIKKVDKVIETPKTGADFSLSDTIVSADGSGDTPEISWIKACNNMAVSGADIRGARILLLLGEKEKDQKIKGYMEAFSTLSEQSNIPIVGGQSEILKGLEKSHFVVTMLGENVKVLPKKRNIEPGFDIVMLGYAGILGSNILAKDYKERFGERFSENFLLNAMFPHESLSIKKMVDISFNTACDIEYAHDVSTGGVYKALFELGEYTGKGICVDNKLIPIKQETIELCDYLDINPYLIDGTGAALLVTKKGSIIVDKLIKAGYVASVIGQVSLGKEKLVYINREEARVLEGNVQDELYKIK